MQYAYIVQRIGFFAIKQDKNTHKIIIIIIIIIYLYAQYKTSNENSTIRINTIKKFARRVDKTVLFNWCCKLIYSYNSAVLNS
jgi:hypothetical protein